MPLISGVFAIRYLQIAPLISNKSVWTSKSLQIASIERELVGLNE